MLSRFKTALYNVVGSFDPTDGGAVGALGTVSLSAGVQNIPSVIRQNSSQGKEKTVRFPYTRPHFLQLNSEDEILVTADHALRPIICPRDISRLPWNSGYAETINAGKSKRNEDQAAVHVGLLTRTVKGPLKNPSISHLRSKAKESKKVSSINGIVSNKELNGIDSGKPVTGEEAYSSVLNGFESSKYQNNVDASLSNNSKPKTENEDANQCTVFLPYYYFGVFDGHAGWGAAVSAANQLHHIIHEKLCDVIELIIPDEDDSSNLCGPLWSSEKIVSPESAIIGALEQAFWTMDQMIGEDRQRHYLSGGCTACVSLFILGKVFVSNAGDSRGVIGYRSSPVPMSFDFTPETETQRIRKLGARHPELLGGEFTHLEFLRRPLRSDVGKKAPFRDHYMKGWALKTITEADLKYPLVCGEGKRSRVLATIGVTRGFGDHDLKAQFSSLPIKPFLSPEPEVRVFNLKEHDVSDEDILILGTDGLWDIMSNEKAVNIVCNSLQQFSSEDSHRYKYRYTSAAHDLVLWSRGRLREHQWRTSNDKHATIDDISAFVIPLKKFKLEFEEWEKNLFSETIEVSVDSSEEVIVPNETVVSVATDAVLSPTSFSKTLKKSENLPKSNFNSLSNSVSGHVNPTCSLPSVFSEASDISKTEKSSQLTASLTENSLQTPGDNSSSSSSSENSSETAGSISSSYKKSDFTNKENVLNNSMSSNGEPGIDSTFVTTATANESIPTNSSINIRNSEKMESTTSTTIIQDREEEEEES